MKSQKLTAYQKSRQIVRKAIDHIKTHGWAKSVWRGNGSGERFCIMGTLCHVDGRRAFSGSAHSLLEQNGPLRYSLAKSLGMDAYKEYSGSLTDGAIQWNDNAGPTYPHSAEDVVKKLEEIDLDLAHCEAQVAEEENGLQEKRVPEVTRDRP